MVEVAEVRKRLLQAIDRARREAAEHRRQVAQAEAEYERFLATVAGPVFRQLAGALRAEGYPYEVFTPHGSLRLASERSREDFIEIRLDTTGPPEVVGSASRAHGSRVIVTDRPVREGAAIADLDDEAVLTFALDEIRRLVAR